MTEQINSTLSELLASYGENFKQVEELVGGLEQKDRNKIEPFIIKTRKLIKEKDLNGLGKLMNQVKNVADDYNKPNK